MTDLHNYARQLADSARLASRDLALVTGEKKRAWLYECADRLLSSADQVLQQNSLDLTAGEESHLSSALLDRLRLTPQRLASLASAVRDIALLPDPVGEVIESSVRPNGLRVSRVRVPLGVVFFIYESRPNVTLDAAALCVKSGNAVILRGGKEALHSNRALYQVLRDSLEAVGLPASAVEFVDTTDREVVGHFLGMGDQIDVCIPRGGRSLIERVAREATMPVIKHFDGICHVYVDASADPEMAEAIVVNSKCQRPGVCNAAESLLVHADYPPQKLTQLCDRLQREGVELRGCEKTRAVVSGVKSVTEEDFRTEYLDLILSVRVVDSLDQAIDHIATYGSAHTDAIVTRDLGAAEEFRRRVDSAAVVINASTRFNDGGELGLGAEIGISTDRFHARGPCGLREMTSYKYLVEGTGQIRR